MGSDTSRIDCKFIICISFPYDTTKIPQWEIQRRKGIENGRRKGREKGGENKQKGKREQEHLREQKQVCDSTSQRT